MSFGNFRLNPRLVRISAVLSALRDRELLTLQEIVKISGLTLTQVRCGLNYLDTKQQV